MSLRHLKKTPPKRSARLSLEERDKRRKEGIAVGNAYEQQQMTSPLIARHPPSLCYMDHTYIPDGLTRNGIFLEAKGGKTCISKNDRDKMEVVLQEHPGLELRALLQCPNEHSVTWCEEQGVRWGRGRFACGVAAGRPCLMDCCHHPGASFARLFTPDADELGGTRPPSPLHAAAL